MDDFSPEYQAACGTLRDRMVDYIRANPNLLFERIPDAGLFLAFVDFDVSDIDPSMAMMDAAWEAAVQVLRKTSMAEIVGE